MIRVSSAPPEIPNLLPPSTNICEKWLINQCKSMEEFKQIHAKNIKLGENRNDRHVSSLIASCALSQWGSADYATSIFRQTTSSSTFNLNNLLRGYLLEEKPECAVLLYLEMREKVERESDLFFPDNFTFTFLLKACKKIPCFPKGQQFHAQLYKYGFHLDEFIQSSLISLYGRCKKPDLAGNVFHQMPRRTSSSLSAIMAAYSTAERWEDSILIFREMIDSGFKPDESSLSCVIDCAGNLGFLTAGRSAHSHFLRISGDVDNVSAETSLVDMYMKCGCPETALKVFDKMRERNLLTYTAVISGLAAHGRGAAAVELFSLMVDQGISPDDKAYAAVLTACARNGMVEEGGRIFANLREKTKQHYAGIIDLFARLGLLEEAYEMAANMEEPHDVIWRSLLSTCRDKRNVKIGELVGKHLMEMGTRNAGDYLLLAGLRSREGNMEEAAAARKMMIAMAKQRVGSSIVETRKGGRHRFVSKDRYHPLSRRIEEMMRQVKWQMRFEGYEEEGEVEGHSLRLAVCFGLIDGVSGEVIRVVRNLRMCRECHVYVKLVSRIFGREIIVREPGRFHRFKDGSCSCGDYW